MAKTAKARAASRRNLAKARAARRRHGVRHVKKYGNKNRNLTLAQRRNRVSRASKVGKFAGNVATIYAVNAIYGNPIGKSAKGATRKYKSASTNRKFNKIIAKY